MVIKGVSSRYAGLILLCCMGVALAAWLAWTLATARSEEPVKAEDGVWKLRRFVGAGLRGDGRGFPASFDLACDSQGNAGLLVLHQGGKFVYWRSQAGTQWHKTVVDRGIKTELDQEADQVVINVRVLLRYCANDRPEVLLIKALDGVRRHEPRTRIVLYRPVNAGEPEVFGFKRSVQRKFVGWGYVAQPSVLRTSKGDWYVGMYFYHSGAKDTSAAVWSSARPDTLAMVASDPESVALAEGADYEVVCALLERGSDGSGRRVKRVGLDADLDVVLNETVGSVGERGLARVLLAPPEQYPIIAFYIPFDKHWLTRWFSDDTEWRSEEIVLPDSVRLDIGTVVFGGRMPDGAFSVLFSGRVYVDGLPNTGVVLLEVQAGRVRDARLLYPLKDEGIGLTAQTGEDGNLHVAVYDRTENEIVYLRGDHPRTDVGPSLETLSPPLPPGSAKRECFDLMRQLALDILEYARDHDERLPESLEGLARAGYIWPKEALCPGSGEPRILNPLLAGRRLDELEDPGELPLIIDPPGSHPDGGACAYVDGWVTWLSTEDHQRSLEEVFLKDASD